MSQLHVASEIAHSVFVHGERFKMTIKFELDVNAKEISKGIKDEIRKIVFKSIPKIQRSLNDKIGDIVFRSLLAGVPVITGSDFAEIGVPDINDRIQSVIRTASNDFKVIVKPANYLIININILDMGYSQLLSLPESVYPYTSIQGSGVLEWLRWLLVEGGGVAIDGWRFSPFPSRFSRTGGGIMSAGGTWNVPPSLQGTSNDNILTRALIGIEKDLEAVVSQELKRLIK